MVLSLVVINLVLFLEVINLVLFLVVLNLVLFLVVLNLVLFFVIINLVLFLEVINLVLFLVVLNFVLFFVIINLVLSLVVIDLVLFLVVTTEKDRCRAVFHPSVTLKQGYLWKRRGDSISFVTHFTFKKRYFQLKFNTLAFARTPAEQVSGTVLSGEIIYNLFDKCLLELRYL